MHDPIKVPLSLSKKRGVWGGAHPRPCIYGLRAYSHSDGGADFALSEPRVNRQIPLGSIGENHARNSTKGQHNARPTSTRCRKNECGHQDYDRTGGRV